MTKDRVDLVEGNGIGEQDPFVPLRCGAASGYQCKKAGDCETDKAVAATDRLVPTTEKFFLGAWWAKGRRNAIGDHQVEPRKNKEDGHKDDREDDLCAEDSCPDLRPVEVIEPEVIGVQRQDSAERSEDRERGDNDHCADYAATTRPGDARLFNIFGSHVLPRYRASASG